MKTAVVLALVAGALLGAVLLFSDGARRLGVSVGLAEGCVACHGQVAGEEGSHASARMGCASCHAGDKRTLDPALAHAGIVRVPGNLADAPRTCGQAGCHGAIVVRVQRSIMATMAGVIAVNRTVLGEPVLEQAPLPHAQRLGHSVADSHLRELCVGCHLGQAKNDWGPIGEQSQGGGCNACHLEYSTAAARDLARYAALPRPVRTIAPVTHPTLSVNPRNGHCFGCHSRSGRIALSYEGWHEMHTPHGKAPPEKQGQMRRKLDDGRWVEKIIPDIHHERGMECIDCHTANEVMGAGAIVATKNAQLRVGCEDCHTRRHASVAADSIDADSRSLHALRQWTLGPGQRMGTTRAGEPLVNLVVEQGTPARLLRKRTGQALALKPPASVCTEGEGHQRLSCASCHAAWAPRCTTCHTAFDPTGEGFDHAAQQWVQGTWNETAGPFEAVLPTLGVVAQDQRRGAIDTFVPGMVMTFDRNQVDGKPPDIVFRRLYAKLFSHTIRRESRSCKSCHNDAVALGYGKGALRYVVAGNRGRWQFRAAEKASLHDGLPADAWTGFGQTRTGMVSTRVGARPFTVEEQRRILRVGACLTCHAEDSAVMKRSQTDFAAALASRSTRCIVPVWPP